jgi:predicted esterase
MNLQISRSIKFISILTLLFMICPLSSQSLPPGSKKPLKEEMRQPWTRNNETYYRHWLAVGGFEAQQAAGKDPEAVMGMGMGTDFLKEHGGEAAIHPTPNMEQHRPDGSVVRWHPVTAFHDNVGVEDQSSPKLRGAGVGYAFVTFQRPEAGKAMLSLGSDGGIKVWVNGKVVHETQGRRTLNPDEDQVEVPVIAGENTVLIKLELRSSAGVFCFRVLEPGARLIPLAEIRPSILKGSPDTNELIVHTDLPQGLVEAAPVKVEVVAAGGKVAASQTAPRGQQLRFESGAWPAGAYEIRFSTVTLDKEPFAAHLPFYKGDAIQEARQLLAAAKMPDVSEPSGLTLQMLADMVRDRLGEKLDALPGNPWEDIHSALLEYEELKQLESGQPGPIRPYGFFRLAYRDEVDGAPQFCRAYLPAGYTPTTKWPLVVNLHGYHQTNPEYVNWYWVDQRHPAFNSQFAENQPVIVIEPHGRGNTSYMGLGEQDILRVIDLAKKQFSVDPDRVYLMGESMGGFGVWNIGTRHPDLFAAIAPIYGGADYHVSMSEDALAKLNPMQKFLQEKGSSFSKAECLLNLPIFIHHGDADPSVNVEYSRYAVRMLQRWGYNIRYRELPGAIHEDIKVANEVIEWFLEHRRCSQPRHVRIRSAELAAASAYWVRIEEFSNPLAFMQLDAEVVGPNLVRLDTVNVQAVTLSPRDPLINPLKPLQVIWNGETARTLLLAEGKITLQSAGYQPAPRHKSPGMAGPIMDLMATPFAVVIGTSSRDPQMQERCQQKADEFVKYWQRWQHQKPRIFLDKEITEKDAAAYSLFLIGGPADNLVTHKLASQLPLKLTPDSIQLDKQTFPVTDAMVEMLYPHPLNPKRYVVVVAGTSADGLFFWDATDNGLWEWDFVILDGKGLNVQSQIAENGRVVSGLWGSNWEINESGLVPGDAEMRAKAKVVKILHLDKSASAAIFKEYVGSYEVAPGFSVHVAVEEGHLMLHVPGQLDGEMFPETETEFFMTTGNLRISFIKDSSGKVTSLTAHAQGQDFPAKKVQPVP